MAWLCCRSVLIVLIVVVATTTSENVAEQWMQLQLNFTGPSETSTKNPFIDVDLSATFSLVTGASESKPNPRSLATRTSTGQPLVQLELIPSPKSIDDGINVFNRGSSSKKFPTGTAINIDIGSSVPSGDNNRATHSIDFGTNVTKRHVIEIPADDVPFTEGLVGTDNFTITSWIRVDEGDMGSGGNRVVNFCKGGPGLDLVWDASFGGRLKLAVNEWPDSSGTHPTSTGGTVPAGRSEWPQWVFFAVTYAANARGNTVEWYFGNSRDAATRDIAATGGMYTQGAVGDPQVPLAFGNFGSGFHANDRLLRGMLYDPRIYTSVLPLDAVWLY
eukprot:m.170087 g.170087  ORF g.170087 m.170087 type:complete len:331 (-) comp18258_c0_seq1:2227-3219(-)